MGRVPGDRRARRRRGRAPQPQRQADGALLPRPRGGDPARPARECVLDGEIVVIGASGRLDFFALQLRVHPAASRVDRLAEETPASFIAFDASTTPRCRSSQRRAALEALALTPPLFVTPLTDDARARARLVRALRGRRVGRRDRQGRRAALPAGRARDVQGQAPAHGRLHRLRLPLHKAHKDGIGSLLLGLRQDGEGPSWAGRSAAWSRSAPPRPSRWRGGASC